MTNDTTNLETTSLGSGLRAVRAVLDEFERREGEFTAEELDHLAHKAQNSLKFVIARQHENAREGNRAHLAPTVYKPVRDLYGNLLPDSLAYKKSVKRLARKNRKKPTPAETMLWSLLRGNQLGYHFRRQDAQFVVKYPTIGDGYIPDFVHRKTRVIVEVDGDYHLDPAQREKDLLRDERFAAIGYQTIRVTNEEVFKDTENVLKKITQAIEARLK